MRWKILTGLIACAFLSIAGCGRAAGSAGGVTRAGASDAVEAGAATELTVDQSQSGQAPAGDPPGAETKDALLDPQADEDGGQQMIGSNDRFRETVDEALRALAKPRKQESESPQSLRGSTAPDPGEGGPPES
jgi:hypothetical protein